jgi:hypothetical protein
MSYLDDQARTLFEERVPFRPVSAQPVVSESAGRAILEEVGKRSGAIPVDNGLGVSAFDIPNEPQYVGPNAGALRRYVQPVIDRIKDYFAERDGMVPYFGNLKMTAPKFRSYWGIVLEQTRKGIRAVPKIFGKIWGAYTNRDGTDIIGVDPVNFDENDPEAQYLAVKADGKMTVAHEIVHMLQKYAGSFSRFSLADTEAEAEIMAGDILGEAPSAYPEARESYGNKYGGSLITKLGRYAKSVKEKYIDPVLDSFSPQPALQPVYS